MSVRLRSSCCRTATILDDISLIDFVLSLRFYLSIYIFLSFFIILHHFPRANCPSFFWLELQGKMIYFFKSPAVFCVLINISVLPACFDLSRDALCRKYQRKLLLCAFSICFDPQYYRSHYPSYYKMTISTSDAS